MYALYNTVLTFNLWQMHQISPCYDTRKCCIATKVQDDGSSCGTLDSIVEWIVSYKRHTHRASRRCASARGSAERSCNRTFSRRCRSCTASRLYAPVRAPSVSRRLGPYTDRSCIWSVQVVKYEPSCSRQHFHSLHLPYSLSRWIRSSTSTCRRSPSNGVEVRHAMHSTKDWRPLQLSR